MNELTIGGKDQFCVLSPKETQERQKRLATLQKIDKEIDQIMSINSQQHSQYQDSFQKILYIE
jgi:hypothetical protein